MAASMQVSATKVPSLDAPSFDNSFEGYCSPQGRWYLDTTTTRDPASNSY